MQHAVAQGGTGRGSRGPFGGAFSCENGGNSAHHRPGFLDRRLVSRLMEGGYDIRRWHVAVASVALW